MPDITPPKWVDDKHRTFNEIDFFDRMHRKKKGEKYRQAQKNRKVWDDGNGTNIDKYKLFEHMAEVLGDDPEGGDADAGMERIKV